MYFLIALAVAAFLSSAAIFSLWNHKRSGSGRIQQLGTRAVAHTDLNPEGAVLIDGALWQARSLDGTTIAAKQQVAVAQVEGHLLLVKRSRS